LGEAGIDGRYGIFFGARQVAAFDLRDLENGQQ
jgi:hypothetical protein